MGGNYLLNLYFIMPPKKTKQIAKQPKEDS